MSCPHLANLTWNCLKIENNRWMSKNFFSNFDHLYIRSYVFWCDKSIGRGKKSKSCVFMSVAYKKRQIGALSPKQSILAHFWPERSVFSFFLFFKVHHCVDRIKIHMIWCINCQNSKIFFWTFIYFYPFFLFFKLGSRGGDNLFGRNNFIFMFWTLWGI